MDLEDYLYSTHREVVEYEEKIKNMYLSFLKRSKCLEKNSGYYFVLQRYWPITKINLKEWILDSDLCKFLEKNGMIDYSIHELKDYFRNYEKKTKTDCSDYIEAIDLYLLMDDIEELIDEKVEKEMTAIWYVDERIESIENISEVVGTQNVEARYEMMISDTVSFDTSLFKALYKLILGQVEKKKADSVFDEECYKYCIVFLNEVFDFFIRYGEYIQTPEDYLYEN